MTSFSVAGISDIVVRDALNALHRDIREGLMPLRSFSAVPTTTSLGPGELCFYLNDLYLNADGTIKKYAPV